MKSLLRSMVCIASVKKFYFNSLDSTIKGNFYIIINMNV